jgi:hypothetical protein
MPSNHKIQLVEWTARFILIDSRLPVPGERSGSLLY